MPHNEEGEFELILGNKEMLSVLFIVVVLLGVFFAMGYIVGRNSAPVESARKSEPYVRTDAPSAMPEGRKETPATTVIETAPESNASPSSKQVQSTTPPASPQAATERSKPIEVASVSMAQPQTGQTFLQVSAVAKAEAEILTELLLKKGFRAIIAPGPSDKVYRVLVGPAQDASELGKTKADLEQAGFKSIVRKY